jgi:hypothetical protein
MQAISKNSFGHSVLALVRPYYWVEGLKASGKEAIGEVIANSYLPNGWVYSGDNRYIDIQIRSSTSELPGTVFLVACRIGNAMHLPLRTVIRFKYDDTNLQRAVFMGINERYDDEEEEVVAVI